jgi:hypothetical protein
MYSKPVLGLAGLLLVGMTLTGCEGSRSQAHQSGLNAWATPGAAQPGLGSNTQLAGAGAPAGPQYGTPGMNAMQANAGQSQWNNQSGSYTMTPAGMGGAPTYAAGAAMGGAQVPANAGASPAGYAATGGSPTAYTTTGAQGYAGATPNAAGMPAGGYQPTGGGASGGLTPGMVSSSAPNAMPAAQAGGGYYAAQAAQAAQHDAGMAVPAGQVPAGMDQRRQEWQNQVTAGQQPGYPQAPTPMPGTVVRQPGDGD